MKVEESHTCLAICGWPFCLALRLFSRPETNPSPVVDTNRNYRSGNQDNFYDPMTGKSKERIGAISKDIFSNEDFREANMAIVVRKYCSIEGFVYKGNIFILRQIVCQPNKNNHNDLAVNGTVMDTWGYRYRFVDAVKFKFNWCNSVVSTLDRWLCSVTFCLMPKWPLPLCTCILVLYKHLRTGSYISFVLQ